MKLKMLNLLISWKFWVGFITSLLILWLLISWYLYLQASTLVFNNTVSWAPVPRYNYELTFLKNSKDENFSIWSTQNFSSDTYILYLHGNAGRIADMYVDFTKYANVVSPAYSGYHESEGSPSPEKTYEIALLTYDWLVNEKKVPEDKIIIFGHSMGGSPATYLASKRPKAKKLILVNTFSSVQSMCFRQYSIFCVFAGNIFNSAENAKNVEIPVRQFVYKNDLTVPADEGRKLYEYFTKTTDKKLFELDGKTHVYFDMKEVLRSADETKLVESTFN